MSFSLYQVVKVWEGMVVLKELILNSFYFGRVWWSWKNWFWTVCTLGGYGGHERTDFEQFVLWEGVVVMKGLILNGFYFGRVWWSWKNWFWTVSTLGQCGGHDRTDFEQFLLLEGVVVLKELILNSFYFGRVWWSWKNWFWTVSTCRGCGGLDRTDFEQFLLWGVWWSWQNWFWIVSTLGGCGGLERTDFGQFLLWESVVVLEEHMGDAQGSIGDIQGGVWTYGGIWASGDIRGCLNAWGHPNIWGCWDALKHMGASTQCPKMWNLHATKENLGVFTYGGVWASGDLRGCLNAWGHPNIWGCWDALKHMGCQLNAPKCRTYLPLKKIRVWTYGGVGGIWLVSKCMGASKDMGVSGQCPQV